MYRAQLQVLKTQLLNLAAVEKHIEEERRVIAEKAEALAEAHQEVKGKYQEIEEIGAEI
jgi:conjugal transfer/entry exclusion protein